MVLGVAVSLGVKEKRDKPPIRWETLVDPRPFLIQLPADWREPLETWMGEHPGEPHVHVLRQGEAVVAGGALFNSLPPGMSAFEDEALVWLSRGYGYLGFIWVVPERRGEGLGQRWLQYMQRSGLCPAYWLTVEEEGLIAFYERCGFQNRGEITGESGPEWLLVWPE